MPFGEGFFPTLTRNHSLRRLVIGLPLCSKNHGQVAVDDYMEFHDELDNFEESYCGEWDSEEDFARHIVSECYNLQLIDRMGDNLEREMGDLARYFDYEAFGRVLFMYDYSMGANGNVLRVV